MLTCLVLVGAVLASGCTSSPPSQPPPTASGSPLPYLPTLRHDPTGSISGVGLEGTLVVRNNCVLLTVHPRPGLSKGGTYLLIFRAGYHLVRASDGSLAVADPEGRYVWRVGDPFTNQLGGTPVGGDWSPEADTLDSLAEPVPPTCEYDRILGTNANIYRPPGGDPQQLPVAVPSLLGLKKPAATKAAAAAGFWIGVWAETAQRGTVFMQDPESGAMAYVGSEIVVRLAEVK